MLGKSAHLAIKEREKCKVKGVFVNVDVVGVGSSPFDLLAQSIGPYAVPITAGGSVNPDYRDKSGLLKFADVRAYLHWRLRELLDPESGHQVYLPPDNTLLADLCAPDYSVVAGKIRIQSKKDLKEQLGRSPDSGDALLLSLLDPPIDFTEYEEEEMVTISSY